MVFEKLGELFGSAVARFSTYFRKRVVERALDDFEKEYVAVLRPALEDIRGMEGLPAGVANFIDELLKQKSPGWWFAALAFVGGYAMSMAMTAISPISEVLRYKVDRLVHSARLSPTQAFDAFRKLQDESYLDDLRDQGFDDKRIEALKELTKFWASPSDIITWLAREVFEPTVISRFGLEEGLDEVMTQKELFDKIGVTEDDIRRFWIAHWTHPSFTEMIELRRRGLISDDDLYTWYALVEIPPYWRELMNKLVWVTPTRVDIRRFWDMGTIDEERLREYYTRLGYTGRDLDDYVLWTKVYSAAPDLIARYKNGWITEDEVVSELVALGMREDMARNLVETKIKKTSPERTSKERDLTKSEIIKGVKVGKITADEATSMLSQLGYSAEEAEFLIAINVAPKEQVETKVKERDLTKSDILNGVKQGLISPDTAVSWLMNIGYSEEEATYLVMLKLGISTVSSPPVSAEGANPRSRWELERKAQEWRKAQGLPYRVIPQELIDAEIAYEKKKLEIQQARAKGLPEENIAALDSQLAQLEARYFELVKQIRQTT